MEQGRAAGLRVAGVLALAVILAIQGIIDYRADREAFPTISMPTFATAPDDSGHRQIERLTISIDYSDGSSLSPTPEMLLEDFRYSSARFSIDHVLKDGPPRDSATVDWLRDQATRIGDGRSPESLTFVWQQYDFDVRSGSGAAMGKPTVTAVPL